MAQNKIPSLSSLWIQKMMNIQAEALSLFITENTENTTTLNKTSTLNLLKSIGEKLNLLSDVKADADREKIRHELLVLQNYSAMAIMHLDDNIELKRKLDENVSVVSRNIDEDELIRRIMNGEVIRFD